MSSEDEGVVTEQRTQLIHPWLGLKPFILIEFSAPDGDLDSLTSDIRFGGGLTEDDLPMFLEMVAESFPQGGRDADQ